MPYLSKYAENDEEWQIFHCFLKKKMRPRPSLTAK